MYIDIKSILLRSRGSFNRARNSEKVQKDRTTLQAFAAFVVIAAIFTAVWYYTGANIY